MISLEELAVLAQPLAAVKPVRIGGREFDTDVEPIVMGTVNLSRDSTYRESIALSAPQAVRKVRTAWAQGAHLVDLGAESSNAGTARLTDAQQISALLPVIEECASEGIALSVETYEPAVAKRCLAAGASVLNMTGASQQDHMFAAAAEHGASLVLCYVGGSDIREITDLTLDRDPIPQMLAHFEPRIERARSFGVEHVVIDPGLGFFYGNLTNPLVRVRHQAGVLLHSARLRELGAPICHALPHAFALFEDEFRTAEGFFAVLARLGGAGMLRTHEVPRVAAVLRTMDTLDATPWHTESVGDGS
jgi:dihydropteroate synthase